ncbi:MAG: hypothetical protein DMG49_27685 [Acidobacteria bacterium]|nr:MAG: hypothetical protein DMG49_27685 [Acidobacteriota bacterium]
MDQVKTRYPKKNLPLDPELAEILLCWYSAGSLQREDWVSRVLSWTGDCLIGHGAFSSGISNRLESKLGWSDRVARSSPQLSDPFGDQ